MEFKGRKEGLESKREVIRNVGEEKGGRELRKDNRGVTMTKEHYMHVWKCIVKPIALYN
jgi:hypothetical protein